MRRVVGLLLCILFFVQYDIVVAGNAKLQFNSNGKFKIVQFTDLHYGESASQDERTAKVQNTILNEENPDLVIITGDLVSGYEWNKESVGWYYENWIKLIQPMVDHNVSWAIALGNHDVEADLTAQQVIELDSSHELSLTQLGPSNIGGAGNYYLPVYNSSNGISRALWMLDSGQNDCMGVKGWGCIQANQVAWYKNESQNLAMNNNGPIPGMAFFHIPLYEHLDLWNSLPVYGNLEEDVGVCCSSVNTGLYTAMKEMGDIKHVFCGHDHNNDYIGNYYGIYLGYGLKTGYGGYGPPYGWKRGARVIEFSENETEIYSWLRLEDKSMAVQSLYQPGRSQWVGCCDMIGRSSATASSYLLFLFNASWIVMAMICMYTFHQCYMQYKGYK